MQMQSRFAGKCRECTGPIAQGETIDYDKSRGGAAHLRCSDARTQPVGMFAVDEASKLGFVSGDEVEEKVKEWITWKP